MNAHLHQPEIFSLKTDYSLEGPLEESVRQKFFELQGLSEQPKQIESVLDRLVENDGGWHSDDVAFLSGVNDDDYYEFFKRLHSQKLHPYIRALLRFEKIGGATEEMTKVSETVKTALRKIEAESEWNRRRLKRHNL